MFYVFNKQKICTYVFSIIAVILLFCVASNMNLDDDVVQTLSQDEKLLPIYSVDTNSSNISLTINCAWNNNDVDQILEVLKKEDVKVTFFMVGDWVRKYPDDVKKIYEAGHEIGTHSDTHPHVNKLTYEENIQELEKSSEEIQKITGVKPTLYRTPYGEYNNTVIKSANESGYFPIQWSLDTLDYKNLTAEEMWNRIEKISSGDIVLMHNGTEHTADSLQSIIQKIKAKGLSIVKVSELIYQSNYYIDINGVQKSIEN